MSAYDSDAEEITSPDAPADPKLETLPAAARAVASRLLPALQFVGLLLDPRLGLWGQ